MNKQITEMLKKLAEQGGAIVSSAVCDEGELFHARATNRFYVDDDGFGYVWRSAYWLKIADDANGKRVVKPASLTESNSTFPGGNKVKCRVSCQCGYLNGEARVVMFSKHPKPTLVYRLEGSFAVVKQEPVCEKCYTPPLTKGDWQSYDEPSPSQEVRNG